MAVRRLNPTTPGQRFRVANAFAEITASKPEKSLLVSLSKSGIIKEKSPLVISGVVTNVAIVSSTSSVITLE
jgi:ribosomal protein L2